MKKSIHKRTAQIITALFLAASLALAGCHGESSSDPDYPELAEGDEAPDFTAVLADGGSFTLSEQEDKIVLLNFWATWCGPCVREMPAFEKLYGEYADTVSIVAVNSMEDQETVNRFISDNGYTFPIAYDEKGEISLKYPSNGIPYTLVIRPDGSIANIYLGAFDADTQYKEYKSAIDAVLQDQAED